MWAVELFWKHLPDLLDQQTDLDDSILGINIAEFAFAAADIQEILVADVVGGGIRSRTISRLASISFCSVSK